jgi:DNA mismatch repair ATPase MutS
LNIPDCQGKESLFQAEMSRCHQQLQMLETAEKQHEFSFNIMDEIFVSTNYKEGMSGAYAIINQLCKFQHCLNIITTHFDVLANMDDLQVNKHYFDIEVDDADNISKDYKLKPGVSSKHMALKLLKKKGFSPDIIKDAEYLYEKISK